MNIFVTNDCPIKSAQYLDDKRVVKMCLETAQMLSTAMHFHGGTGPYKLNHVNHPCTVWTRESRENYVWLLKHFKALSNEYTRRYGKVHKSYRECYDTLSKGQYLLPSKGRTDFANCAANKTKGISYKHISNVHDAYKQYLKFRWKTDTRQPTWT